jgi:hypothetical protein
MNSDRYKGTSDGPAWCKTRALAAAIGEIVFKRRWPHLVHRWFSGVVLTFVFLATCSLAVLVKPSAARENNLWRVSKDSDDLGTVSPWQGSTYAFATQPK